jgi:hypothetical protein
VIDGVTPAMARRGLRSLDDEAAHIDACLPGSGLPVPEAREHRLAEHRARMAWAEVEYAAWLGGNSVGLPHPSPGRPYMQRLLEAAYVADARVAAARQALATASL